MQATAEAAVTTGTPESATDVVRDWPVREYVGAMATEMAQMARWQGDETLALALEKAAELASAPGS